jgi:hypothetical protein
VLGTEEEALLPVGTVVCPFQHLSIDQLDNRSSGVLGLRASGGVSRRNAVDLMEADVMHDTPLKEGRGLRREFDSIHKFESHESNGSLVLKSWNRSVHVKGALSIRRVLVEALKDIGDGLSLLLRAEIVCVARTGIVDSMNVLEDIWGTGHREVIEEEPDVIVGHVQDDLLAE